MSKSLLLMLCLVTGLLVLACSGGTPASDTNRNGNNNNSGATTDTNRNGNNNNTGTTPATADAIGIAECDTFLKAYDDCVTTKVPEAVRAQYKASIATWRSEWKKLADNPQTRGTLAGICKTQLETARTQLKAFNCTF